MTAADEGITGTSLEKRTSFKCMLNACRKGKIDRILCKSISRFARNTVDCLDTVRELRLLGIPVYLEKDYIKGAVAKQLKTKTEPSRCKSSDKGSVFW